MDWETTRTGARATSTRVVCTIERDRATLRYQWRVQAHYGFVAYELDCGISHDLELAKRACIAAIKEARGIKLIPQEISHSPLEDAT